MITHVVLFKLKDRSAANVAAAVERIRALEGQIPTLRSLEVGADVVRAARSYDVGLIARFDDMAGLAVYRDHPRHLPVLEYMGEVSETAAAVDFES